MKEKQRKELIEGYKRKGKRDKALLKEWETASPEEFCRKFLQVYRQH